MKSLIRIQNHHNHFESVAVLWHLRSYRDIIIIIIIIRNSIAKLLRYNAPDERAPSTAKFWREETPGFI